MLPSSMSFPGGSRSSSIKGRARYSMYPWPTVSRSRSASPPAARGVLPCRVLPSRWALPRLIRSSFPRKRPEAHDRRNPVGPNGIPDRSPGRTERGRASGAGAHRAVDAGQPGVARASRDRHRCPRAHRLAVLAVLPQRRGNDLGALRAITASFLSDHARQHVRAVVPGHQHLHPAWLSACPHPRAGPAPHRRGSAASRAVSGLDLAAGALLRMARLAATAWPYQYLALGPRSHRWTTAARAQLHGHEHRHGAHHAAVYGAAALHLDARHQSRLYAGCGQSWGFTGASLLADLRAVVATRPRC